MKQTRRKHSAAFKAEVALAAIKERESLAQLSERYGINQTTISTWKTEFLKHSAEVFSKGSTTSEEAFEKERTELYAKIGELEMQRDWLKKKVEAIGHPLSELRALISTQETLSIQTQCDLLGISKSGLYYTPRGERDENLAIMKLMDEHHTFHPTHGVLQLQDYLFSVGFKVNHKRVRRLMRKARIHAHYPKRNLSKLGKAEYIHPYLLRGLKIKRPNQVWAIDITYIRMSKGFMYLTAIIDIYSRYVVGWGLHNSLHAENVKEVLDRAISINGKPNIVNSDQGSQFTSEPWISKLTKLKIRISMDGKGRATDNIYIERFWRTLKQDWVYSHPVDNGAELWAGIKWYIEYYNKEKTHQGIGRRIPERVYRRVA